MAQAEANGPCPLPRCENQPAPSPVPRPNRKRGLLSPGADRFAEGQEDLAPEDVEEVGWSGAVHNNPVALVELAHVEVVQFLPPQPGGISRNTRCHLALQLQQWGDEQHPAPLSPLPPSSPPPEHRETQGDLREMAGLCPQPWGSPGGGQQPPSTSLLGLLLSHAGQQLQGQPGHQLQPVPKPSWLQHKPRASHTSCYHLRAAHPDC